MSKNPNKSADVRTAVSRPVAGKAARNSKGTSIIEIIIVVVIIGVLAAVLIPSMMRLTRLAQETKLNADYATAQQLALVVDAAIRDGGLVLSAYNNIVRIDGSDEAREYREALRPFYEDEWPKAQSQRGQDFVAEIIADLQSVDLQPAEIRIFTGTSFDDGVRFFPRPTE